MRNDPIIPLTVRISSSAGRASGMDGAFPMDRSCMNLLTNAGGKIRSGWPSEYRGERSLCQANNTCSRFPLNRRSEHVSESAPKKNFSAAFAARGAGVMLHRVVCLILAVAVIIAAAVFDPKSTSDPVASPQDRAREDLSRYEYPSMAGIKWKAHFVRPQDSMERLFGDDWIYVARFNRIDRRHTYPEIGR